MTVRQQIEADLHGLKQQLSDRCWVEVERIKDDCGVVNAVTFERGGARKILGRWVLPDKLLLYRAHRTWRIGGCDAVDVIRQGKV